jgi:hypothetical protein
MNVQDKALSFSDDNTNSWPSGADNIGMSHAMPALSS